MHHQSQKDFQGIFVGMPQYQKGYLVYVHITRKILSSHDVVFEEKFSSVLAYKLCPHSEALDIRSEVLYIPYASSSHEQTGNIITFVQLEEDNLVEKN